jgi:small subunit ribosomal protein S20
MANIKGGIKRARQAIGRRSRNRGEKSKFNTVHKKFLDAITAGDKTKAKEVFSEFCSILDKTLKHGVVKANLVNRTKSRAAKKLAALK